MPPPRAKGWIFTTNNPVDADVPALAPGITFVVYQRERGAEGTEHFQGYVLFADRKRLTQVKEIAWLSRSHLEVRRGTNEQAIAYCTKVDTRIGDPVFLGERPTAGQGKSQLLAGACRAVRAGTAVSRLDEEFDMVRVRNGRGLKELEMDLRRQTRPAFRHVHTEVLWGPTNLGKTRYAYATYGAENVFKLTQPPVGYNVWFDGYVSQDCLLIDDFEGWVPYRFLLNLLDGYPLDLPVKGSFVAAMYTKVVITSNVDPALWYREFAEFGAIPAPLERRIAVCRRVYEALFDDIGARVGPPPAPVPAPVRPPPPSPIPVDEVPPVISMDDDEASQALSFSDDSDYVPDTQPSRRSFRLSACEFGRRKRGRGAVVTGGNE